jgi:hypothetical protein
MMIYVQSICNNRKEDREDIQERRFKNGLSKMSEKKQKAALLCVFFCLFSDECLTKTER